MIKNKIILIIVIFIFLFYGICCSQPYYDLDTNQVPKDGVTDSTSDWNSYINALTDGCIIILPHGAVYYLNTSGGLVFDKNVHIIGNGATFLCGANIGNNPTLTFTKNNCILEGFKVDCINNHTDGNDEDFQDAGDDLEINLRKAIKITGNNTVCRNLKIYSSVIGIGFVTGHNGKVENCYIDNNIVISGTSSANNYHCGIFVKNSDDVKIATSDIYGHGQGILISESYGTVISGCTISGNSNNGIYSSSGPDTIISNNQIMSFDTSGIKSRGYGSIIEHNRVFCNISGGAITGISITGNGENGSDGFNGYGVIVSHNIITGDANAGIYVGVQDSGYLKDPQITFNNIRFDTDAVRGCYGVQFSNTSSDGAGIIGNIAVNHSFGLIMSPASGRKHDNTMIANNNFTGGSNDAFSLNGLRNPIISNNFGKNCASSRSGIMLYNTIEANVEGNNFGDSQEIATQKYGIEEGGDSTNNQYIYNITDGVITNEYRSIDPNSVIVN